MRFLIRLMLARVFFHPLEGLTRSRLNQILDGEQHRISLRYRHKVFLLWLQSAWQTHFARLVERKYGKELATIEIKAPVFILGHFRSGTTHLHELMSLDSRFASASRFQAYQPASFLVTERWYARFNDVLMLPRRVQEDEIALMNLSGMSPYLDWCFPDSKVDYQRFMTFRGATTDEATRWKECLRWFLAALTIRYRKPLILKSPPHTARIRLILKAFPDARFIHIKRNPYHVFVSMIRLYSGIDPVFNLRARREPVTEETVLKTYEEMYDAFFEDVPHIPPGQFCEVAYEDLEKTPIVALATIYRELGLGDFQQVAPAFTDYLKSIEKYRKNRHPELEPALKQRIAARWSKAFKAWSYPTE